MEISLKAKHFVEKDISKGDLIFSKGEKSKYAFILNKGRVACFLKSKDKRIIPIQGAMQGAIFGEDAILSELGRYEYYAVALEDSSVTLIPRQDVFSVLNESSDWVKSILFNISNRVHATIEVVADHKLVDDKLFGEQPFSQQEEKLILKSFSEPDKKAKD